MQSQRNNQPTYRRARASRLTPLLSLLILATSTSLSTAQDGPPGITTPEVFADFDPDAPSCNPPPGLRRVLAFAQDNEREFIEGVGHGLSLAAGDRKLEYQVAVANNDAAKQVEHVETFLAAKVGALTAAPVDPTQLSLSLQRFMWAGGYVSTVVAPPATSLLNAPQYLTGKTLGDAAAAYINDQLDGKAEVVLLTQDSIEFLAPRFVAIREVLERHPRRKHCRRHFSDPRKQGGRVRHDEHHP